MTTAPAKETYLSWSRDERNNYLKQLLAHNNGHVEWLGRESKYAANVHYVRLDATAYALFADNHQMLVDFCDGGAYNFGGHVTINPTGLGDALANVTVYID